MVQLLMHLWGDYITQSQWMAENKAKAFLPAAIHALIYSTPFIWLSIDHGHLRWHPWLTIMVSHFFIDRYRIARYVVWTKNHMSPDYYYGRMLPFYHCRQTGYPPQVPEWLAVWLLVVADNTLHLTINYAALRYL